MRVARLALVLVAVTAVVCVGCSEKDPIVGGWRFSHGLVVTFHRNGTLEIVTLGGAPKSAAKWKRDGNYIEFSGSTAGLVHESRYLVHKIGDNELVLKGVTTHELLSAVRSSG